MGRPNKKRKNEMKIKFNVYRKKSDGTIMLYANAIDRKVSVGISDNGVLAAYGRDTPQGQRNVIEALKDALASIEGQGGAIEATPDFDAHTEDKARLGDFGELYITATATAGGVSTGSDGAFLHKNGKLYDLSFFAEV